MSCAKFNWFRMKSWYFPHSMKLFNGVSELEHSLSSSVVALGNFDGLHLGHRALMQQVCALAAEENLQSVVYTFSPHPASVLNPQTAPKALFSREDLAEQLALLGLEYLILEPFTRSFSKTSAHDFLHDFVLQRLHPKHIVIGENFTFGHQRQGSAEFLREQAPQAHFHLHVIPAVNEGSEAISSSRIRHALLQGQPELARRLLGRPFSMQGTVVAGAGRGRTLGIPTANFFPGSTLVPKEGVYLTRAKVGSEVYPAVTNIGKAPTFHSEDEPVKIETYILDQNLHLLGTPLRLEFISYLREEKRFSGREQLVEQIHHDILTARKLYTTYDEVGSHRPASS